MRQNRALRQLLAQLAAAGIIPRAATALSRDAPGAVDALRDAVLAEIPAFSESGNPEVLPALGQHIEEHLSEIQRLFEGGELGDFEFVKAHAHRRAEQRFPLEMTLHAYRCGHRILAHWLRDAALAVTAGDTEAAVTAIADFAIEYTNAISTVVAAEYVARARALAEAEGDQRTELLNLLLTGHDESDARVARLLKRAGYLEQRQAYCVAVVQSTNPTEMENPARTQRIADALSSATASTSVRILTGLRDNLVVAVLRDTRRLSGWTPQQKNITERILPQFLLLGPAVLVGLSSEQPSTSFLPKALVEAKIALDFADVTNRVVLFAELPLRRLLIHRAGDYLQSASPAWITALVEADAKAHGALVKTMRAMADANLNVQLAGRLLEKHPNTVYARLERIRDLTGLNSQTYHDLTELLLAVDCRKR